MSVHRFLPMSHAQLSSFADGPSSCSPRKLSAPEEIGHRFDNLELDNVKSPVSVVNEIMLSRGSQIQYNLVSTKGEMHCPKFIYCAESSNIIVHGIGHTKKEAKKNAAIAFLRKIDVAKPSAVPNCSLGSIKYVCNDSKVNLEVKTKLNYIGMLQELCISNQWELPVYDFSQNKLDETWFAICCLHLYKSKGEEKTKQSAKMESARLMYEHIKRFSQEEITFFNSHKHQILTNSIIDLRTLEKSKVSNIHITNILKSKKPYISNLKKYNSINEFKMKYVDILKKIGEEEGFNVIYYDINVVNSKSKKFKVSLELSSSFLTHSNIGNIKEEIQEAIAFDVLSYFKLMLEN